jgi:protein-S-isoprenylcysteine O-methyltransferase Ste14
MTCPPARAQALIIGISAMKFQTGERQNDGLQKNGPFKPARNFLYYGCRLAGYGDKRAVK